MVRTIAGLLLASAALAAPPAADEAVPLLPETVESSDLGKVKILALRFSDTVEHGRAIRPTQTAGSWAPYMAVPFEVQMSTWGIAVDRLLVPDVPPGAADPRRSPDGVAYDVARDREHWLSQRPRVRGRGTPADRFDAYLLGDFAHREHIGLFVTSEYWARYTLLNRKGQVVFSKVYPASLRTLAFNINRVNLEAKLVEGTIPAAVLADLKALLLPQ